MTFVGRVYLQTREPHPDDVPGMGVTVPVEPPRCVVAIGGTWGRNIAVRWPDGRVVVRPSRGLRRAPDRSAE